MDMIHKRHEGEPKDFISGMPDNVITNILDRLPLQDAVRTDILSRNWRFLLHLNGDITKFVLFVDESCYSVFDVQDIKHWVLFLSKKGIRDLTLENRSTARLKLPTHLFSCLELEHLKLVFCGFNAPDSFHGFPNLLSLELGVILEGGKFGEFLTRCPILEILNMNFFTNPPGQVKQAEIAKLTNLKILSLLMCNLDNRLIISSQTIFELLDSLPKLQELDLDFIMCKFIEAGAKKRFPTIFPCLKTLKLSRIDLENGIKLACVFQMIMSFPNLQMLDIESSDWDCKPTPATCPLEIDYSTMGLQQLQNVVFTYSSCSENEVSMIKYILACSPFLKKIVIRPHPYPVSDEKFIFARKLLKLYRASPAVDIDLS
ncbi:hypothetical protein SSX86_002085 [Deinandra increscens subsp. villosa]|uniref:F-box domain-containing protein n=1 Tax=Deinandra increscens subsp. villosa TaxID=3103831 RepID=A0AAP0H7P7_9ASTR